MKKIASFWVRKTKEGETFLAGLTPQGNQFLIFKNKRKTEEEHPDWLLYDTGQIAAKKSDSNSLPNNQVNIAKDFT